MRQLAIAAVALLLVAGVGAAATSGSGVHKTQVTVQPDPSDGLTYEQRNVRDRYMLDNRPGSVKHLYVVSASSGQVLIYSTVRGKVTSSGKRLNPSNTIVSYKCGKDDTCYDGTRTDVNGRSKLTTEILQDDGAYGSSVPYIFWWDAHGRYHQHFFTDGQVIQISDQPLAVRNITLNFEQQ